MDQNNNILILNKMIKKYYKKSMVILIKIHNLILINIHKTTKNINKYKMMMILIKNIIKMKLIDHFYYINKHIFCIHLIIFKYTYY